MAWSWLRRRADRGTAPAPAAVVRTAPEPVRGDPAWPGLPPLQRTLAPLSPVAPLDAFTGSLTTHQNPSFLAPLGHHVDPGGPAGLVSGLARVAPGRSVPYAGAADLAVRRPAPARPVVQRLRQSIGWSAGSPPPPEPVAEVVDPGVETVDLGSAPEAVLATHLVVPPPPETPTVASPRTAAASAVAASSAQVAALPLPTVARAVPAVQRHVDAPEAPVIPGVDQPDITAPVAETAPLVGTGYEAPPPVAEPPAAAAADDRPTDLVAPVRPTDVVPAPAHHPTETPPGREPSSAVTEVQASTPAPAMTAPTSASATTPVPAVQRTLPVVPDRRPRTAGLPDRPTHPLPVVARASLPTASVVVQREAADSVGTGTDPMPTDDGPVPNDPPAPATEDAPLSGFAAQIARLTTTPGESAAATSPADAAPEPDPTAPIPPVQRLAMPQLRPPEHPDTPALFPGVPHSTPRPPSTRRDPVVQRRSDTSPVGGPGVEPAAAADPAAALAPAAPIEPIKPTVPTVRADHAPAAYHASGPLPIGPPVVARAVAAGAAPPDLAVGAPAPRTTGLVSHRASLAVRADLGSAVPPAPAVPRVSYASPATQVQRLLDLRPGPRVHPPVESGTSPDTPVQVCPVTDPVEVSGRAAAPIRPPAPVPLQRRSIVTTATTSASPRPASGVSPAAVSGPARSFAAMFAAPPIEAAPPTPSNDHPGYTTVQLQTVAAEPAATPPEPAPEPIPAPVAEPPVGSAAPPPTAAAPAGVAAPTAGAAAANLDEMARRLFEPLSARLRAELWLDRERAGLVTDARH